MRNFFHGNAQELAKVLIASFSLACSGPYIQMNYVKSRNPMSLFLSRQHTIFFPSIDCSGIYFRLLFKTCHTSRSSGSSPELMSYSQLSPDPFHFLPCINYYCRHTSSLQQTVTSRKKDSCLVHSLLPHNDFPSFLLIVGS